MTRKKKHKVIIDTNLFISFLIGKKLNKLKHYLDDKNVVLVFAEQIIQELDIVTSRKKIKKYFTESEVSELKFLILTEGEIFEINETPTLCRDPKDNFLLGLAKISKADYLITGDKDILELKTFNTTKIITFSEYDKLL